MADPIDYGAHATADSAPINYGAHSAADQPDKSWSDTAREALHNLPSSAVALVKSLPARSGIGQTETLPAVDPNKGPRDQSAEFNAALPSAQKSWDALKQFGGHVSDFLSDPMGTIKKAFAADPLGTIANVVQVSKGLHDIGTSEAAANAASAVKKTATAAGNAATTPGVLRTVGATVGAGAGHATGVPYVGPMVGAYVGKLGGEALSDLIHAPKGAPLVNPAVARVAEAFDRDAAKIQTPGQAPVAGPVGLPGPLGAGSWAIPRATALEGPTTGTGAASVAANVKPIAADPLLTRAAASRPAIPQSGLTAIPPEPSLKMQGAIPYDLTQNAEVAKGLPEGVQRAMPDGKTQTLRQVPIEQIEGDPGNTIYPDRVEEYQKNGYAVQPELRANPEGGFIINEGHHRILADVKNGKDSVLAWTPDAEQAAAKAEPAPKANVIPFKNAEADAAKSAEMETNGRAAKTQTLAQSLHENGLTHDQLSAMPPAKLKATLSDLTKALKINKTGNLSDASVSQTLFELKSLERAQSVSPELLKKLQDSGALKTAQDLARRMQP